MIQSMTGYGKADAHFGGKKIHVEIKSLNSKSLDLNARIAPLYREREIEIRKMITPFVERGKVDFSIWTENENAAETAPINAEAVKSYVAQLRSISEEAGLPFDDSQAWQLLVRLPDTTAVQTSEELTDEEWDVMSAAIKEALQHLVDFRKQEGEALYRKFKEKIDNIARLMKEIEPFEKSRVQKIRERLEARLEELRGVDYDKNRLEQELIYYIEKLDISEEKQRLTNHLNYFCETMDTGHAGQGKKLGFIAQEMGREINTTGSKSNQAEMQNIVVMMKDELEQIKEQVLNVM
ncbi:YicC/YloC family endoribonuclease [Alloprevotella rava]|uniref:Uncharacterized protein (TIGR00255 family) n=1 Tax=Alloprevotella rava TaxID=671218 RepID=A0A7W5Y1Y8_9BACT|nr:YicC/YloC family endoribonuclease [Alloprevotella rava]MBB3703210.1 uncharacterized protein (TIGR00255 family) [Alloprevotella rava]